MDLNLIPRHFARIGAELRVEIVERNRRRGIVIADDYQLNIEGGGKNERFILSIRSDATKTYDFLPLDTQPNERHLLLMARRTDTNEKQKFLCGHDERHWFVAGVPDRRGITGVRQAMDALKPQGAVEAQRRAGVKSKNWNRRHNDGFIRQGEWFFVPRPEFAPKDSLLILRDEPLRRGAGKPHTVRELYRVEGEPVYVCGRYPNGVSTEQYRRLLKMRRSAAKWDWKVMKRNPTVYVRGTVRHQDHKTIELPFWHQVSLNEEWTGSVIAFLD